MSRINSNPAILAAQQAQEKLNQCLDEGRSFRLEAGAGAGKTYSLVQALKRIIADRGASLLRAGQKVACITYTQVARNEIAQEIEQHPAILVDTIHAFSWSFLAQFQKSLRAILELDETRREKIIEAGGVAGKTVEYNLGFFGIDEHRITLAHDDIPKLMAALLSEKKFRKLLAQQFPIIFIDEYQDTNQEFMAALSEHFFATKEGPQVGLFGDHWQTIYKGDFALADFPILGIDKKSNFRSVPAIVNVLNRLRAELPQEVSEPTATGEAIFFHTNSYTGERLDTRQSKADLPEEMSRLAMAKLRKDLAEGGWDLSPNKTKVLMLTHNVLAIEQGYPNIARILERSEAFAKKEDPVIEYFTDTIEPMARAYAEKRYGAMFGYLGNAPRIKAHSDKLRWRDCMEKLQLLRTQSSIGEVLDHVSNSGLLRLPDRLARREEELRTLGKDGLADAAPHVVRHAELRQVQYREVIELVKFVEGSTPFATQHSVKGAEFDNVLVVLGGGWNHYNWPQLLEILQTGEITAKNAKAYHRARNLFYVSISRPRRRLAVLATQQLSPVALEAAAKLFLAENVRDLDLT